MKAVHWILVGLASAIATQAAAQVTLMHVRGLAYSPDGKRLMIPSHHGLAVYENGKWSKAPRPQHAHMGLSATGKNLYSSGHPAPGSGLINPFGLLRSRDGGKTWEKLGLEGESDFHLLATGWNTNAVYVWNPAPSSQMKRPGLHYTLNDGFVWTPARASGLEGDPRALAVHPDDAAIVAAATSSGVFLSRDSGERFVRLAGGAEGLSVHFDLDGRSLWYGTFDGREDGAARGALGDRRRGEDVIQAPPDVALAQIAPRRPPGEEVRIIRVERAPDVHQVLGEEPVEELALLLPLPYDAGLALARMHVHVGACDVHVAAQNELAPVAMQLFRPSSELDHEAELRLVVFAAVGHVHRGDHEAADFGLHDARFHVELGVAERGLGVEQALADVKRHAGVGAKPVPVRVVVLELDLLGNLRKLGLQLLQAHDVRPGALHPFAKLRLARAHAVDVPGGDFHFRCVPKEILRYLTLRRGFYATRRRDRGGASSRARCA